MVSVHLEFDFRPVLRSEGKSLMGAGRAKLLRRIEESGSLSKAAKEMGMSYRHAWGIVHHMEEICGEKIVRSARGGADRGKSVLTDFGAELLAEFERSSESIAHSSGECRRKPSITTDGILVVNGKILLVRRKKEPFKGKFALPGGFVEYGETVEECVVREFQEETGIVVQVERLLGIYSSPDRDPRGHTISAVFVLSQVGGALKDSDETHAEWSLMSKIPTLAFDHSSIIADYVRSARKSR